MKPQTKAIVTAAALAGLLSGCTTPAPKKECKACPSHMKAGKGSCGAKGNCSSKGTCRAKGNCGAKSS